MAHDQLTIGIVQFPATLNPDIDALAAKSYVLGFASRPFTVFDADWKIVCLLCTELPSFENGRAVKTELPGGKTGVDLTYTIRDGAMWADGVPVTTDIHESDQINESALKDLIRAAVLLNLESHPKSKAKRKPR